MPTVHRLRVCSRVLLLLIGGGSRGGYTLRTTGRIALHL